MQIKIADAGKLYKRKIWGLKNFNLEINPGILGLVGPNGAGKSTLLRMLSTNTRPTRGKIFFDNTDIAKSPNILRKILGYLPQDFGIYPNLNALEFLEYMAAIKGIPGRIARQRINQLLNILNLEESKKRPLGGFSGGMKQRVGIAQALLNDPGVIILDEPTAGLDPEERIQFRHTLSELAGDRIIILSSHIVSDIEAIATDIVFIDHGDLIIHDKPDHLLSKMENMVWQWKIPAADIQELRKQFLLVNTMHNKDGIQVRLIASQSPGAGAIKTFPNLEDAYLYHIKSMKSDH